MVVVVLGTGDALGDGVVVVERGVHHLVVGLDVVGSAFPVVGVGTVDVEASCVAVEVAEGGCDGWMIYCCSRIVPLFFSAPVPSATVGSWV